MLNAKRPAMIGLSLWKSWTAAMYRSAVDFFAVDFFAAAMIINTIYVYILNVMRLFNDCIIIVSDLNRWYVPKCCQNFGSSNDEYDPRLYIECEEAYEDCAIIVKEGNRCYIPKCYRNFGGRDDEINLRLDVKCGEAQRWLDCYYEWVESLICQRWLHQ